MKKSRFNLSHNSSLTADMGYLIPFCVLDCLPNDSMQLRFQSFLRAQPMLAPLMHVVNLYTQWWYVPYRILWNNWTEFITGGEDGSATPTFPTITISQAATSSLADYFCIPTGQNNLQVSALPFRAYAEIWNTRYRDEDLQDELPISYDDGDDKVTSTTLQKCSWAKDYFTTARPFTQRGSQISVPIRLSQASNSSWSSSVSFSNIFFPVDDRYYDISNTTMTLNVGGSFAQNFVNSGNYNGTITFRLVPGQNTPALPTQTGQGSSFTNIQAVCNEFSDITLSYSYRVTYNADKYATMPDNTQGQVVPLPQVGTATYFGTTEASNNAATSLPATTKVTTNALATVNFVVSGGGIQSSLNIRDLRLASSLQRYQERSLEWGNRYEEFIQREFGIKPRDARIQRPEYLGGGKGLLQISEVLQTAEGTNTGVGTMRGHAIGSFSHKAIRFRCPEHGVIIGLLSIRPHADYTQGLRKFWKKFTRFDYFTPELANIGMQEVYQSELYADGTNDNVLFGYAPRYAEYRSEPNRITGEFKDILNFWNLARNFENAPQLTSEFITMNPSKRIFADQTSNSFLIQCRNDIRAYRVVPKRAKNILK